MASRYGRGDITEGDFAERYETMSSQPAEMGRQLVASLMGVGQRRSATQEIADERAEFDRGIAREAAKDGTLINALGRYESTVSEIQGMMQNGLRNYIPAREKFRELQALGSDNQAGLDLVMSAANRGGALAEGYARTAAELKAGNYANKTVRIGGMDVTLGQLFDSDNDNPLGAFDIGKDVADVYLGDDRDRASAVGVFVDKAVSAGGPGRDPRRVYNVGLLNEAAEYVANGSNYARMESAFGKGNVASVCSDVLTRFGSTGGMRDVMDGLVKYAESRGTGLDSVRNFMSAVSDATTSLFADPATGSVQNDLDPSERRWALVTSLAAMNAATARGAKLDFGDDRVAAAARAASAAIGIARRDGYDLYAEARAAGRSPMDDYVSLIGAFMDNSELTPDTFVSRHNKARSALQSMVFTAPVTGQAPVVQTGARGYYSGGPSRASGVRLTSDAAGKLMDDVNGAIMRETRQRWLAGADIGHAVEDAILDTAKGGGRDRLAAAVSSAFVDAIPGLGGRVLADRVLTPYVLNRLMQTERRALDTSEVLGDIATKELGSEYLVGIPEVDAKAAVDAAQNWYVTNVSQVERFSGLRRQLVDHFMDGRFNKAMTGEQAAQRADVVLQEGVELWKRTNRDRTLQQFVDAITDTGVEYGPVLQGVYDTKDRKAVEWKDLDANGMPVMSDEQRKRYQVVYRKFRMPDGTDAGNEIAPRPIRGVNAMRLNPGFSAWAVRNAANREIFEKQQKFYADPKNYEEK